jgi:polysaccharide export outer membrane protein
MTCRNTQRRGARAALAALLFATLMPGAAGAAEPVYGINAGDVLQVFVWNEETLSRELLVAPDGTISFPMVGMVRVRGLSTEQIGARLAQGLGEYLRDEPVVTVSLTAVGGNKIYVHGLVTQPGAFVVTQQVDILQALALAGGLQTFAKEAEIKVVRRSAEGQPQLFGFNYARFKNGQGLESNILLESGDVVVVP